MAETGIAIRLSLQDAEVVARGLEQLGGQGERALKRIEAAAHSMGHEAPAAFRAMEVAAERAQGKFEEFAHHAGTLGRMLEQFGPLGLGAPAGVGAITLAFDHLIEGAKESFEQMHKLETTSERLGIGITALQELHFAFGHLGIDIGDADGLLAKLNKTIGSLALGGGSKAAQDALARLGLSVRDMHGEIKSADEFLPELASAIQRVGNPAQQTALAVAILGKNGALLLPALREGAEGIEYLTEKARETGAVLDAAFVEKGAEATKTIHDLAAVAETDFRRIETATAPLLVAWEKLRTSAASALADFLESFRQIEERSSQALRHESEDLGRRIKISQDRAATLKTGGGGEWLRQALGPPGAEGEIAAIEKGVGELQKEKEALEAMLQRREEENKAKPPAAGLASRTSRTKRPSAAPRRRSAPPSGCAPPTKR